MSKRIDDIKNKIKSEYRLEDLQKEYPITKALYVKLGGILPVKPITLNISSLEIITGKKRITKKEAFDSDVIIGSLLGDGNIYKSKNSNITYCFSFGHTWAQIGYVKMKVELLRSRLSRIRLVEPDENLKDYSIHSIFETDLALKEYYELFYSQIIEGKSNPQKYILKKEIVEKLTYKSLAIWAMDDGKKYGIDNGFSITIGKQPYYNYETFSKIIELINEKLDVKFDAREENLSYELSCFGDNAKHNFNKIKNYIWPDFSYKFGVLPEECGLAYKNEVWFKDWMCTRHELQHPFLEKYNLKNYRASSDELFKQKFFNSLLNRTKVRGFPYYFITEEERELGWSTTLSCKVKEENKTLRAAYINNLLPSSYMNHRFKVCVGNKKSPYEAFHDKKILKRILQEQLKSGSNIENSNIRNALGFYGSQVAGQFNPAFAKFFIDKYCQGLNVLDPCAGWGGRLCGTVAKNKNYYGIEPCIETYNKLIELKNWLSTRTNAIISICNGIAEDPANYNKQFDFAITSPPYFNKEKYSKESTQSYIKYPEYTLWKDNFLKNMILNVYNALKSECFFVINVGDIEGFGIVMDSILISKEIGFSLEDVYKTSSYKTGTNFSTLTETFLVLKKG